MTQPARPVDPPRRIRVGVLGAGAWARFAHLHGYQRDDRCEVVAIADPNSDLANAAANDSGSQYAQVVGTMRDVIPERMARATGRMMRMNIDDGDIVLGEFANGALGSAQTSSVTVGNYPGLEARVYGSKGALICRLLEEKRICESLKGATADEVAFRDIEVPTRFYPEGGSSRETWRTLFYANLVNLVSNFLTAVRDGSPSAGGFVDGARVQEVINAVERSFRERRWVALPLDAAHPA